MTYALSSTSGLSTPMTAQSYCLTGGAGFSTYVLGAYVHSRGGRLISVDNSAAHCAVATAWTQCFEESVSVVLSDSIAWLSSFEQPIDVLFLDSLDTESAESADHGLCEIKAAYSRLHAPPGARKAKRKLSRAGRAAIIAATKKGGLKRAEAAKATSRTTTKSAPAKTEKKVTDTIAVRKAAPRKPAPVKKAVKAPGRKAAKKSESTAQPTAAAPTSTTENLVQ